MDTASVCQTCGTALTPDSSPGGLCPSCLFAQALSSPLDADQPEEFESPGLALCSTFGPFRIEAVLGRGGMSTVYRAREEALDRVVALKVLPPEFLHDETFARRFQQEARIVARLEHPQIVPIFASGIEGGVPWMSMRVMAGGSLETLVRAGGLGHEQVVGILRQVAAALDYAHARGVVHRDLKPSNILLDHAGGVCIGDFGLAHLMDGSLVRTRTGVIAGTPLYMAPEQALGKPLDHRVDLYSLAVVAYEMLTGRPPFDGDSPVAILMKHATDPLPVPSTDQVPHAMFPALRKALSKDPMERWPTATAFVSALENSLAAPVPARGVSSAAFWATLVAVAAIGLFVVVPSGTTPEREPRPDVKVAPAKAVPAAAAPAWPPAVIPPAADVGPSRPSPSVTQRATTRSAPTTLAPPGTGTGPAQTDPTAATTQAVSGPRPTPDAPSGARADAPRPPEAEPVARPGPSGTQTTEAADRNTVPPAGDPITEPVRIRTVNPTYPELARAAQIEGDVVVEAAVGPDGGVTGVRVLRSVHPLLDEAARQAVLQYKYRPGRRNGVAETFRVQLTVSFKLR